MKLTEGRDRVPCSRNSTQTDAQALGVSHILAPTDLSVGSRKAVNYALRIAQRYYAKLTLLHLFEMPRAFECAFGVPEAEHTQQNKDREKLSLLALYDVIRAQHRNTEPLFRGGEPRSDIPAIARSLGVDLIVISTHDSRWLRRVVEGSDARKIVREAPCPILVVR
jgi:nucleotide-binding universal stress UspA family protein